MTETLAMASDEDLDRIDPADVIVAPLSGQTDFLERFQSARETFIEAIRRAPAIADMLNSLRSEDAKYLIEWPKDVKAAVTRGAATWRQFGDGTFAVVIRNKANAKIVKHLRLRRQDLPREGWFNLGSMAIQGALSDLAGQLEELDVKIDVLLQGNRAERLGRLVAALDLYGQARAAQDPALRRQLLVDAIQTANEARGVFIENARLRAEKLSPPTLLAQWTKSVHGMQTPSEGLGAALMELTDDVKSGMVATRLLTQMHGELGEAEMARLAIEQFEGKLSSIAERVVPLLRHAPRDQIRTTEDLWAGITKKLLPATGRAQRLLKQVTQADALGLDLDFTSETDRDQHG